MDLDGDDDDFLTQVSCGSATKPAGLAGWWRRCSCQGRRLGAPRPFPLPVPTWVLPSPQ